MINEQVYECAHRAALLEASGDESPLVLHAAAEDLLAAVQELIDLLEGRLRD